MAKSTDVAGFHEKAFEMREAALHCSIKWHVFTPQAQPPKLEQVMPELWLPQMLQISPADLETSLQHALRNHQASAIICKVSSTDVDGSQGSIEDSAGREGRLQAQSSWNRRSVRSASPATFLRRSAPLLAEPSACNKCLQCFTHTLVGF